MKQALTYAVCEKCLQLNRVHVGSEKSAVCGACKTELPLHGAIVDGTDSTLPKLIQKSPLPVVIDVWAPWCGPCRVFAPTFEEFSTRFVGRAVFAKLNSDLNQQVAGQFGIRGIPTILVFKKGNELTRQSGVIPKDSFEPWLNQFVE